MAETVSHAIPDASGDRTYQVEESAGGSAGGSPGLDWEVEYQQQTNWCWAAVATSVNHYYTRSSVPTQCEVVNGVLRRTDCCSSPDSGNCNVPYYLDRALGYLNNLQSVGPQGTYQQAAQAISSSTPLCIRIGWSGGGGHFIAVNGVQDNNLISITDPWYGDSMVTFDTLVNGTYQGSGRWTHTYFTHA